MKTNFLRALVILACCFAIGACSSTKGKGSGEGGVSDEDLGIGGDRFGEGNIPKAESDGPFGDIHFDYDSSAVPSSATTQLQDNAKAIAGDPSLRVEIEGHCDKRGTNEYNMALGDARAKAIAKMLVGFGAPGSQLSTISYGEEIPLDPADNDAAYAKNRRAHFALYRQKGPQG